jgi:DNA-binding transcriptional MocR family regulator
LSRLRNPQQRGSALSGSQFLAVVRWWGEKRALRERLRSTPSKTQTAREIGVARGTLDRVIKRANRRPPSNVARSAGGSRRTLTPQQWHRLYAWHRDRESIQAQQSRLPEARALARQLGVSLKVLRRALAELNGRR